ncbi:response regulator [Paraburkholderia sp. J67]|uniref:response regulator n=1 Tax=Paraburkholderia sp. J67 TaxID=2805435 RepID=UPI002ABD8447|nr:response regulator [Paraburkholderia sp. J67]
MNQTKSSGMEIAQKPPGAGRTPDSGGCGRRENSQRIAKNKGALAAVTPATPAGDARRSDKRRMATVLLVDDDINALNALKELVGQEGYRVRTAEDGTVALRSALADPPDVVISDCMMPHMDGLSLMREMRRNSTLASVPLVLVSALVTLPADADVVGFLRKPFAVSQLLDILHRIAAP